MTEAHQNEINQILQDAASKLSVFKEQLEKRRDNAAIERAMKELEERFNIYISLHFCFPFLILFIYF